VSNTYPTILAFPRFTTEDREAIMASPALRSRFYRAVRTHATAFSKMMNAYTDDQRNEAQHLSIEAVEDMEEILKLVDLHRTGTGGVSLRGSNRS